MLKFKRPIDWPTALFLTLTPLLVFIFVPWHLLTRDLPAWALPLTFLLVTVFELSITAGYHRLLAHRSYQVSPWLKKFLIVLSAGAWQGSALKWCSEHRRHHRMIDTDEDPYSAKKGFFYSHFGWLLLKEDPKYAGKYEADLQADAWIRFQHRYYVPLAIAVSFLPPLLIGWFLGDVLTGFLYLGVLRIVVAHHATFLVNSAAHFWGWRPYNENISARDNFVVAFLTFGEGYHNFHHVFEGDYRNGIRWYQWDPTKWLIQFFAQMGWVKRLNRVSDAMILKAKLQAVKDRLEQKGLLDERLAEIYRNIDKAQTRWRELKVEYTREYRRVKRNIAVTKRQHLAHMKMEIRLARLEFNHHLEQWKVMVRSVEAMSPA